jgi:hypothetical protein
MQQSQQKLCSVIVAKASLITLCVYHAGDSWCVAQLSSLITFQSLAIKKCRLT